jgi:hypothetical protein
MKPVSLIVRLQFLSSPSFDRFVLYAEGHASTDEDLAPLIKSWAASRLCQNLFPQQREVMLAALETVDWVALGRAVIDQVRLKMGDD